MNYPIWIVPFIGGTWVIGIIAIVHVFVSHFAVGGGAFLFLGERAAFRGNDEGLYSYLKLHSRFFLLLTSVFGAATGVGIWWAISLVNPDGTHTLIQNFTLAWALEYLFFAAELATAFVYYYTWDKISKEQHLLLARLYFILSVCTLIIINGILTFQLTPGNWLKSHYWGDGFFNPTYYPALCMRLVVMFALAGLYALLTSCFLKDEQLRSRVVKYSAKWLLPLTVAGPFFLAWYLYSIPQLTLGNTFPGFASLPTGSFQIVQMPLYTCIGTSVAIVALTLLGPLRKPAAFSLPYAIVLMVLGLVCTGTGEWSRELLRKPYVVHDVLYSNGVHTADLSNIQKNGFLASSVWAKAVLPEHATRLEKGEMLFRFQCMSCHTTDGYRGVKKLLGERSEEDIRQFFVFMRNTDRKQDPELGYMPPYAGTEEEADMLADYLAVKILGKAELPPKIPTADPGQAVFNKAGCVTCHAGGGNLINPTKPIKGAEFAKKYPDDTSMAKVIREGVKGTAMTAHDQSQISDTQMTDLIKFIRSLTAGASASSTATPSSTTPSPAASSPAASSSAVSSKSSALSGAAAGEAVFDKGGCRTCHAAGGNMINPKKPIKGAEFARKYPDDASMAKVIREGVKGTAMTAHDKSQISDTQMTDLVKYIRSLSSSSATSGAAAPGSAVPGSATPGNATPGNATPGNATPSTATTSAATTSAAKPSTATPSTATPSAATPSAATPSAATPSTATPSAATPSAATPSAATPSSATPSSATPSAATPSSAASSSTSASTGASAGAAVFDKSGCAACHAGGGNMINPKKPIKGAEFAKKYPNDASMAKVIRQGLKGTAMAAYDQSKIKDSELSDLIKYVRSLTP